MAGRGRRGAVWGADEDGAASTQPQDARLSSGALVVAQCPGQTFHFFVGVCGIGISNLVIIYMFIIVFYNFLKTVVLPFFKNTDFKRPFLVFSLHTPFF